MLQSSCFINYNKNSFDILFVCCMPKPCPTPPHPTQYALIHPSLYPNTTVIVILFSNSRLLSNALLRPHQAYENSVLKGPLQGINFPFSHYVNWANKHEKSVHEETLYLNLSKINEISYLIALTSKDPGTIRHEYAHAIFHFNETYQKRCKEIYSLLSDNTRKYVESELKLRGYEAGKFVDEFQGYLVERIDFVKKSFGMEREELMNAQKEFRSFVGQVPKLEFLTF